MALGQATCLGATLLGALRESDDFDQVGDWSNHSQSVEFHGGTTGFDSPRADVADVCPGPRPGDDVARSKSPISWSNEVGLRARGALGGDVTNGFAGARMP